MKTILIEVPESSYDYNFEHWMIPGTETPEGVWSISYHFRKGINAFEDAARRRIKTTIDVYLNPRIIGTLQDGIFSGKQILSEEQRVSILSGAEPEKKYVVLLIK